MTDKRDPDGCLGVMLVAIWVALTSISFALWNIAGKIGY